VLTATKGGLQPPDERLRRYEPALDMLAKESRAAYRALVWGDADFVDYFRSATPIDVIERLKIGSRPASRRPGGGVETLRAIPWVFAWTQSRHLLSAWYGVGQALETFARTQPDGLAGLRDMYEHWPFFRAVIDNAEVSLAKTDLGIAAEYAALVRSATVRNKIHGAIRREHRRSVEMVLKVVQRSELLENQPVLAQSIARRNPYVDPLNYLQLRFLTRWRKAGEKQRTEVLRRLLALSVNGIAFGMKSTG
ncbi:MAG: phosphoenolpyruvate carboxylase, partial [Verrucomicrobiae bacterium]|nr:phosphoenolpyruvate carboxylase [Verrucomicrobiae bacterium]